MLYAILFLLCQDVDRLIQDLGHEKSEVRETATKTLTKLGKRVIPKLEDVMKRSNDTEIWQRATQVITDIKFYSALDSAINSRGPVSLLYQDTPVRDVLKDLTRQSGFDTGTPNDAKISIDVKDGQLIPILDEIGAKIDKRWSFHKNNVVWVDGFSKIPSTYHKGMRVSLSRLDAYKSTSGKVRNNSIVWTYLDLQTEPQTRFMGTPVFELESSIVDGEDLTPDHRQSVSTGNPEIGAYESSPFTLTKTAHIGMLTKISGKVKMQFIAKYHDMVININREDVTTKVRHNDMVFSIQGYNQECTTIMDVDFPADAISTEYYVDYKSLVLIDEDDVEYKGEAISVSTSAFSNPMTLCVRYEITLKDCPLIKTVKFKVVDETVDYSVPFSFHNISIP